MLATVVSPSGHSYSCRQTFLDEIDRGRYWNIAWVATEALIAYGTAYNWSPPSSLFKFSVFVSCGSVCFYALNQTKNKATQLFNVLKIWKNYTVKEFSTKQQAQLEKIKKLWSSSIKNPVKTASFLPLNPGELESQLNKLKNSLCISASDTLIGGVEFTDNKGPSSLYFEIGPKGSFLIDCGPSKRYGQFAGDGLNFLNVLALCAADRGERNVRLYGKKFT